MEILIHDIRYAIRKLAINRGFTVIAVLTLALGIGATTAIFSVVDAALLQPLPFHEPDRLMVIRGLAGPQQDVRWASYPEIRDWKELTQSFDGISIYNETTLNLSGTGEAAVLEAEIVSPGFFALLGVAPQLGRGLLPKDDVPGAMPSVVISDALWKRRFGGTQDVIGRTITLDYRQSVIVGVMPAGFRGFSFDTEIWATLLPFAPEAVDDRGSRWLAGIGRLRPGVSQQVAQADLTRATSQLAQRYPDANAGRTADFISLHQFYLDRTRTLLFMLFAAVGFLLLIACVNVANLQLVRGIERRGEIALRHALGGRRGRLVRQLTTEAIVLTVLGGIAGIALALPALNALIALLPPALLPGYMDASLDGRALLFAAAVVGFTGVVSGIVPALRSTRSGLSLQLRASDRGAVGVRGGAGGFQRALVTVEVALAVALMIGAALIIRSLVKQLEIAPGFQPDKVIAASLTLNADEYPQAARIRFVRQLTDDLQGTAGIASVAVGSDAPLRGGYSAAILIAQGHDKRIRYYRHFVTPGYFRTLGIPLIRGRGFKPSDDLDAPRVVIVSEAFAGKLWPGLDPVGRYIQIGPDPVADIATVIGVAGNVRFRSLTTDLMDPGEDPDVYYAYAQRPNRIFDILVRSATSELTTFDVIRRAVAALDPAIAVDNVEPLGNALAAQTAGARFGSVVLGVFAAVALTLFAIGLYGVMAFLVASRQREIAVRMALGAPAASVLRMLARHIVLVVGIGAAAGITAVLIAGQWLSGLLYGVRPTDPASIAIVILVLLAAAALAFLAPARRAMRVDPMVSLRQE